MILVITCVALLAVVMVLSFFLITSQRKRLERTQTELTDQFKGMAASALEGNARHFLELAKQVLSKETESAKNDLSQKKQSIDDMVKPLKETLDKYQQHLREIENQRHSSYANIEKELKRVIETGVTLSSETRALKDALKKPHVRGNWGEVQLKNCVELAGMSEYADVTFQDTNEMEDGRRLIPDMTVKMPGGRIVIVDSKAPMEAFLASLEATTDEQRKTESVRHGRQVKDHVKKLSMKAYSDNLEQSADFTVMFLPNESFLYAALETEPDLVEYAIQKKILIATPPTFIGLLKVIRFGWNEQKLAQNAQEISDSAAELYKRLVDFFGSFENIGHHLDKAKSEYEIGFARFNSRVLVQARKIEKLGIKVNKKLPEGLGEETLPEPEVLEPVAEIEGKQIQ